VVNKHQYDGILQEPFESIIKQCWSGSRAIAVTGRYSMKNRRAEIGHQYSGNRMQTWCVHEQVNGQSQYKTGRKQQPSRCFEREEKNEQYIDIWIDHSADLDIIHQ
jgi:hypothetical protein